MNVHVSFRHMESSDMAREYAVSKLERVTDKYVQGRIDADVVLSVEKFRHIATLRLQIKNLTVKAEASSEDMYSSIDLVLDKVERQLRRHKERLRDYQPSSGQARSFRMSVVRPPEGVEATDVEAFEEEDFEGYEESAEAAAVEAADVDVNDFDAAQAERERLGTFTTSTGDDVEVSRPRSYEARALSLDEAVVQLDLMEGREFFVFTNSDSERINIIYRRNDGTFGLIET